MLFVKYLSLIPIPVVIEMIKISIRVPTLPKFEFRFRLIGTLIEI